MLGNHLPRQCGIATFTTDLSDALAAAHPEVECFVLAMNDRRPAPRLPAARPLRDRRERARLVPARRGLPQRQRGRRRLRAARVRHLRRQGRAPRPRAPARAADARSSRRCTRSWRSRTPLQRRRDGRAHVAVGAARRHERARARRSCARCTACPRGQDRPHPARHPAPARSRAAARTGSASRASRSSSRSGCSRRTRASSTSSTRSRRSSRAIPRRVYIVLGATHPHVKEQHGETYRLMLENRAQRLGVDSSMIFHNRFVSQSELAEFLAAADIYVTPYLKPEQITSGTLAYAVGSGKAVISTPYWYARELLADGRGVLVPWRDPQAIAREVDRPPRRRRRAARAAASARPPTGASMLWPAVARSYVESFERARAEHARAAAHASSRPGRSASAGAELPGARTSSTCASMTDDTGMLQHAALQRAALRRRLLPRRQRARAPRSWRSSRTRAREDAGRRARARVALPRVRAATRSTPSCGRFRNFMSYSRRLARGARLGGQPRPRALGARARWSGARADPGRQSLAGDLFHAALPARRQLHQPARVGVRAARHRRVPARLPGRQRRRRRCARRSPSGCSTLYRRTSEPRLAVVRGPASPTATRASAGAARVGRADGERGDDRRPACARSSGSSRPAVRRRATSLPSAPTASTRAAARRPPSTSSRSRRARWSRRASRRSA